MIRDLAILLLLSCPILCQGQQAKSRKDSMLHIASCQDFEVDGRGLNPAWNKADWVTLSRIKGDLEYETKIKLLYSDKGLYALYSCEDSKITSTIREDFASLWREDVVELFLWPDEEYPIYLEYELSPHNYELVILVPNLNGQASGWVPWNYRDGKKVRKATNIIQSPQESPSWTAEFFIPYSLMRPLQNVPPKKGTRWRANLYRIDYDRPESTYWSWQPVNNNFHEYEKFGVFLFD